MEKVVIATTTLYKDLNEIRARLALNTIREANNQGYKIVVVDGSPENVKEVFREARALVLNQKRESMRVGRRQAISEATCLAGSDGAVIWMEPEKTPFIPFLNGLLKYFFDKQLEFLIPGRKSLSSYPESQRHAEWLGNQTFRMLTGKNLDVWFGPRIFCWDVSPYFLNYQGEYGDKWDSIFIPILRAMKDGKKISGIKIDYVHPKEQKKEEEKNLSIHLKRIEQLVTLTNALKTEAEKLNLISKEA